MIDELEAIAANYGHVHEWNILRHDILEAVARNPLEFVKPKPIKWVNKGQGNAAASVMGVIYFTEEDGEGGYALWIKEFNGDWAFTFYPTLEAAQAAAYDDRLNRVKELF